MYLVMDKTGYDRYLAKSIEDKLVPDETVLRKWLAIKNNGKPVMVESDNLAEAAKVRVSILKDLKLLSNSGTKWQAPAKILSSIVKSERAH